MTLHDLLTLLNLPIGTSMHNMTQSLPGINIGVQYIRYISEYIPKLQLHQHSLLTRKVFSRHNFISTSLLLCIIWIIFIFKSSSSRSVSSLDLDHHHWIWIITRSRSSLVLEHLCWIIIMGAIS